MIYLPAFEFLDGVGLGANRALVIAAELGLKDSADRPTALLTIDGEQWAALEVPGNVVSVARAPASTNQIVALAKDGRAFAVDLALGIFREEIVTGTYYGELIRLHAVADRVWACGMRGQVYSRSSDGVWSAAGAGLFQDRPTRDPIQLTDIAGSLVNGLYCVGCFGVMARYEARAWHRTNTPTDRSLEQAISVASGEVYACGDRGILLRGRDNYWELIDTALEEGFWGMAWFRTKLYLATLTGLSSYDREAGLMPVATGLTPKPTTYRLDADANSLWSFGSR